MTLMKDAYVRILEAWLDQWSAKLDESQARIDAVMASMSMLDDEQARAQGCAHVRLVQHKIEHARATLDEGRSKVEALRQSSDTVWNEMQGGAEAAWETFKTGAEASWGDLTKALDRAATRPVAPGSHQDSVTDEPKQTSEPT